MKISKEYGPQFDPTDGTVGKLQLVKRWVIVRRSDGQMWQARQGRYTYPSEAEAIARKDVIERNNSANLIPAGGLGVEPRWCYPVHFDPVGPVE
jgi:hypothetical protein